MNMKQQARFVHDLHGMAKNLSSMRDALVYTGFLDSFELRQADASLKAAIDHVTNACNHISKPLGPKPTMD